MNFRIYIKKRLLDGTWSDPICIQDSFMGLKEAMLVDPTLNKKKSSAGSFEASVHYDNIALKTLDPNGNPWIEKGNTRVYVKAFRDISDKPGLVNGNPIDMSPENVDTGLIVWDGRILSCDTDFYNQPKIHAEGSLSFLGDVLQPKQVFAYGPASKEDGEIYKYAEYPNQIFRKIIAAHNAKDTSSDYLTNIKFIPKTGCKYNGKAADYGTIWPDTWVKEDSVVDGESKQASKLSIGEESTLSALTKFLNAFGGGIRVTWEWTYEAGLSSDIKWCRYIEWITEDYDISKQNDPSMVRFSVNLLDMTRKTDASSVATYIMPRGYKAYSGGSWAIGDDLFAPVEELYPNGRDSVEHGGSYVPEPRIVSLTTWTSGCYIAKDNVAGAKYVWAPDISGGGGGQHEQTMATGYLDFRGAYDGDDETYPAQYRLDDLSPLDPSLPPNTGRGMRGRSIKVQFGEVYYISLEQSDNRVTYVVTAGPLGENGSIVTDIGTASGGYWPSGQNGQDITKWDHHKVEIRKPSGKYKAQDGTVYDYDEVLAGRTLYLNISSRGTYYDWTEDTDIVDLKYWKGEGPTPYCYHRGDDPYHLGPAGIWKGRKIPDGLDEYITLKGLGDGSYSSYFYTLTVTSTGATGITTTSKEIVVDCPEQPESKNVDIMYPRAADGRCKGSVATADDLPNPVSDGIATGDWYNVGDEPNVKVYVAVQTSTGLNRWYVQRKFHRDGYYVYDVDAVKRYGRIEKILDISDAHNPDYLEEAALQELYNAKFEEYSLDLSAIDAQILSKDADLTMILDVMDPVYTYSEFHGVASLLPIEELEIPFNDLGSMSFNLSFTTTQRITSNITTRKR